MIKQERKIMPKLNWKFSVEQHNKKNKQVPGTGIINITCNINLFIIKFPFHKIIWTLQTNTDWNCNFMYCNLTKTVYNFMKNHCNLIMSKVNKLNVIKIKCISSLNNKSTFKCMRSSFVHYITRIPSVA